MPLKSCAKDGNPGWKYGASGTCYAYTTGDAASEKRAKKAAIRQAIAINGGTPKDLHEYAEEVAELETVDLEGVAIMEAAYPARGQGSAPGGDIYDDTDLDRIAADTNAVIDELKPFVKLSHSKEQRLAKASGLYLDDGETPATGWLHNLRRDDQGVLRTNVKAMPKKLARLMLSGAFRLRSPELRPFKTADGETKPLVVQALSLHGAKPVAFKTLDDIYAMYHDPADTRDLDLEVLYEQDVEAAPADLTDDVRTVEYQAVAWNPSTGASAIMRELSSELNGPGSGSEIRPRFRVDDIDSQASKALVCDYGQGSGWDAQAYWLVPFTANEDGSVVPAAKDDWTRVEQAWVEATGDYAERLAEGIAALAAAGVLTEPLRARLYELVAERPLTLPGGPRDTTGRMPNELHQLLGLGDDATDEQVFEAVKALKQQPDPPDDGGGDGGGGGGGTPPPGVKQMSEDEYASLLDMAKAGVRAEQTLYQERRDRAIDDAIKEHKVPPADRDKWVKRYDEAPTVTGELLAELKPDPNAERVYGSDSQEGSQALEQLVADEVAYRQYCELTGVDYVPNQAVAAAVQARQNGGNS